MLAHPWGPLRTPRIWGWVVRRAEESPREGAPGPQHGLRAGEAECGLSAPSLARGSPASRGLPDGSCARSALWESVGGGGSHNRDNGVGPPELVRAPSVHPDAASR